MEHGEIFDVNDLLGINLLKKSGITLLNSSITGYRLGEFILRAAMM